MNTIILKKHLTVSKQELVPAGLIVNLGRTQKQAPQYGLVSVDRDKEIVVERGEIRIQKGKTFL